MTNDYADNWVASLSAYQRTEQYKSLEDVSYSPGRLPPLVPQREKLSDRGRAAKRQRIVRLAKAVIDGQIPALQSVYIDRDGYEHFVKTHLKGRGGDPLIEIDRLSCSDTWHDVDDHDTILRQNQSCMDTEAQTKTVKTISGRTHEINAAKDSSSKRLAKPASHRRKAGTKGSSHGQQALPNVYKKTKALAPPPVLKPHKDKVPFKSSKAKDDLEGPKSPVMDDGRAVCSTAKESPFIFHKKRNIRGQARNDQQPEKPSEHQSSVVQQHLNHVLPNSPTTGRISIGLRQTLREEMRDAGADLTSVSSPAPSPSKPRAGHLAKSLRQSIVDTQAMILEAQKDLLGDETRVSPLPPIPADQIVADTAARDETVATADTQAILNAWTPWSKKALPQEPGDQIVSASRRMFAQGGTEDSILLDSFMRYDSEPGERFKRMDSPARSTASEIIHGFSTFQAGQPASLPRAQDMNVYDDITDIALVLRS